MAKLLLVEDDKSFGEVLKSYLELSEFNVDWVDDGMLALPKFASKKYDLVILDVMLPHVDGFTIARQIKESEPETPFIFITAKTLREDILKGYKSGADDYITKPFDTEILLFKIKAILNRGGSPLSAHNDNFSFGKFKFNVKSRVLYDKANDSRKTLSPKESELLKILLEQKGNVLPKSLALNSIWGDANYFTTRSMDVYITKLRKHLSTDRNVNIITVHGSGYRLVWNNVNATD
ncbi:MAG: response regulator transcription factor [Chlorobi bacterium]|nr:response regulator transcription factor [Chlorobiota bacterium]